MKEKIRVNIYRLRQERSQPFLKIDNASQSCAISYRAKAAVRLKSTRDSRLVGRSTALRLAHPNLHCEFLRAARVAKSFFRAGAYRDTTPYFTCYSLLLASISPHRRRTKPPKVRTVGRPHSLGQTLRRSACNFWHYVLRMRSSLKTILHVQSIPRDRVGQ